MVTGRGLASLLDQAIGELKGDGVALGAAVRDTIEFVCRGSIGGRLVGQHTVFYGASVTKQFIGVALAETAVRGLIDIEDPVTRWIPELPDSMARVRLDHLVHHTSGILDLADPAADVPVDNIAVIEGFQQADPDPPEPGARFCYNNAGYVLLAEALARCRQQPVEELVGGFVRRLGLQETRLGGPAVRLAGRPDPPGTIGDGGLWTSAGDMLRWLQACNRSTFGAAAHRLAESTTTLLDGTHLNYAWGVRVAPTPAGRLVTHGGSWDTWLAKTVRIPEHDISVAVLSIGADESEISRTGTEVAQAIERTLG